MCILVVILLSIKLIYGMKTCHSGSGYVFPAIFSYVTETATCTKRQPPKFIQQN